MSTIENGSKAGGAPSLARFWFTASLILFVLALFAFPAPSANVEAQLDVGQTDPDSTCAPCHAEIYKRYRKTPMANASGPATEGFIPADFTHEASGVHYRVTKEGGRVWLSYERENAPPDRSLNGRQELRYFIGSGKRGRTYLFQQHGYWFESPINWYAKKQLWDMAPNFLSVREMPLTMPVDPGCLHCHASNVTRSLREARNFYSSEPFTHGGIACASCHGNSSAHVASGGKVHMLKIDTLQPVRRDSVCLNCHLEGQTAVIRNGKEMVDFVPGEDLFDFAAYFVFKSENGSGGRATSQWEALLRSECKKKSGDRMTCTTCHDPHGSPAQAETTAFYREKCLQCHAGLAEKHHPENPDCTSCHMARSPSSDIAHEQVTDHWIRKRINNQQKSLPESGELEAIGGLAANDRDLGLAYAQMATRGNPEAAKRALVLLRQAEHTESGARGDYELHAQLGFLEQRNGENDAAAEEYQMALEANPYQSLAAGDLALLEASRHRYAEALRLWKGVFDHDPAQLGAGMNLAVVECGVGNRTGAMTTLERLLEFSPDNAKARVLADRIRSGKQKCEAR